MRKIIFVVAFFSILQSSVLIDALELKDSGAQKGDLPRAFLPKTDTHITIHREGEALSIWSNRLTLEEILERIAAEKKVTLRFYCQDPGLNRGRTPNLRIWGDSIVNVLRQLLSGDYEFLLFNTDGKAIEDGKDIAIINILPKGCGGTDRPLRVFMAEKDQYLLRKPPEEITYQQLEDVLKRGSPVSRRRAVEILGIKNDEKGIAYVKEALNDDNPGVMFAAATTLNRLGQKYGTDKVSGAIYSRFREKPYAEFLPVIAEIDREKIWPIAERLTEQSGEKEKGLMVRALFLTQDRRAIKYLLMVANQSIENAKQAIYAIGKIGGAEAVAVLVKLLREGDVERQAWAAQAVHFLPTDGLVARAEVEEAVRKSRTSDVLLNALVEVDYLEPLEKLMKDAASNPGLKVRAVKAMRSKGSRKTVDIISMGMDEKAAQVVRIASVEAMGSFALEEAIPHLIKATEDKDAKVKIAAIKGLSEFPETDSVAEALGKTIHDPDQNVRKAAVDALRLLGKPSEKMIAILNNCKNHEDPYVADKADSILKYWGLE